MNMKQALTGEFAPAAEGQAKKKNLKCSMSLSGRPVITAHIPA
jgi:hypothetical protein